MPLSEDEQRILQEMENKLYAHDRAFVDRVRTPKSYGQRPLRFAVALFVAGFAVVLLAFRSSLILATCGFLVMLFSALAFERGLRSGTSGRVDRNVTSRRTVADELSTIGRRFRSRFRQHH